LSSANSSTTSIENATPLVTTTVEQARSSSQPVKRRVLPAWHKRMTTQQVLYKQYLDQCTASRSIDPPQLMQIQSNSQQEGPLSPEQQEIHDCIVQGRKNVFFTGAAGTGKSVLLRGRE
jgi:ATP-dependent DNA helicase PIF1